MTKATRRATKTDTLIQNAKGELNIRGLNRHRIIPRVVQPPSGGANTPPSGQGSGSTGNFLEPQGDTMIGAIAFFPKVATIDRTDPTNHSIDIANIGEDYSTYVLTGTATPESLATILNATFSGQLLYLQMTAPGDTTIINGNAGNSGNILTGTGIDEIFNFGDIITLIFDATASTGNVLIQGAWRIMTGSSGGGGGATQLNDLTDVTITTPLVTEVLTFDGALWVNAPAGSGSLNTDLSNMISPTFPTVNLSMNGNDIDGVANIDMDGTFATIEGIANLQFFQTAQSINSLSLGLTYQTGSLQKHSFVVGGTEVVKIEEPQGGVFVLDMLKHRIDDIDSMFFDITAGSSLVLNRFSIGFETAKGGIINLATGDPLTIQESGTQRIIMGELTGVNGWGIQTLTHIIFSDTGISLAGAGNAIWGEASDVFVNTSNGVKNMKDIGAGGAGNSISQGNSNVTVTDTGVGAVTIAVDGASIASFTEGVGVVFDKNLNMVANDIISSGNISPSGSSSKDVGSATLFYRDGFFDQIKFQNTNNRILGDSAGINYEVISGDTHDFGVSLALKMRISSTVINIFNAGLDLGGGDISNVDDIIMQNTGSVINMAGGNINSVQTLAMNNSSSFIDMAFGNINNVVNITGFGKISTNEIEINTDLNHDGNRVGFFGQPPQTRKTALLPAGVNVNDIFISLFNLIQALGNLSGFGYGLVNSGQ